MISLRLLKFFNSALLSLPQAIQQQEQTSGVDPGAHSLVDEQAKQMKANQNLLSNCRQLEAEVFRLQEAMGALSTENASLKSTTERLKVCLHLKPLILMRVYFYVRF